MTTTIYTHDSGLHHDTGFSHPERAERLVAIYEVLQVTPKVRELILRNASADDIKKQAIRDGMKTLRMCALTKVAQGLTTLEEAVSNSASDQL